MCNVSCLWFENAIKSIFKIVKKRERELSRCWDDEACRCQHTFLSLRPPGGSNGGCEVSATEYIGRNEQLNYKEQEMIVLERTRHRPS